MGTDITLYLEQRVDAGWEPALDAARRARLVIEGGVVPLGWWSARRRATDLFFAPDALFAFAPGLPHDLSLAMARRIQLERRGTPEAYEGWISLAALDLGSWERDTLFVG